MYIKILMFQKGRGLTLSILTITPTLFTPADTERTSALAITADSTSVPSIIAHHPSDSDSDSDSDSGYFIIAISICLLPLGITAEGICPSMEAAVWWHIKINVCMCVCVCIYIYIYIYIYMYIYIVENKPPA